MQGVIFAHFFPIKNRGFKTPAGSSPSFSFTGALPHSPQSFPSCQGRGNRRGNRTRCKHHPEPPTAPMPIALSFARPSLSPGSSRPSAFGGTGRAARDGDGQARHRPLRPGLCFWGFFAPLFLGNKTTLFAKFSAHHHSCTPISPLFRKFATDEVRLSILFGLLSPPFLFVTSSNHGLKKENDPAITAIFYVGFGDWTDTTPRAGPLIKPNPSCFQILDKPWSPPGLRPLLL